MDINNDSKPGSWEMWAKYLVSEVQRSGKILSKLEDEMKNTENKIKILSMSNNDQMITKDLEMINKEISILRKDIESSEKRLEHLKEMLNESSENTKDIAGIKSKIKEMDTEIKSSKNFENTMKVAFSVLTGIFSTTAVILGIWVNAEKNDKI